VNGVRSDGRKQQTIDDSVLFRNPHFDPRDQGKVTHGDEMMFHVAG
jgi:hypothetical protein